MLLQYYSVLLCTTLYYSVLHSTTPVLLCTTKYYSSTTLYDKALLQYYKVLIQYYSVLQSTTPALYYKVLLQFYSVLQSTTPYYTVLLQYYKVLLCTTYKVLLQFYSVLQSTTPYYTVLLLYYKVLLCTTKYYSSTTLYYSSTTRYYKVPLRTTQYYKVLLQYYSVLQSTTPYYTVKLQYYSVLQSTTPVLLCTTKYYSSTTLYYKELLRTEKSYMKCHLHCPEQQVSLSNLTKYCACHEKLLSWLILVTYETSFSMRGATSVIVQCHQMLRLPRKMTVQNLKEICWKQMKRHLQCAADPRMIRDRSEHETVSPQPASQPRLLFTPTTSILYLKLQHFALRLSFQISPNTAPATKSDTATSPSAAPATKSNTWTSPNAAPATKNDSHDQSFSHMKRYLQCAEQQLSLTNLTKYCACHEKWMSWLLLFAHETLFTMRGATSVIVQCHQMLRLPRKMTVQNLKEICWKQMKRHLQCAADPRMIRDRSEHETVSPQPASQPRLLFTPTTSILHWKLQHFALRLSFQISPNTAPATKSDTATSPSAAPATKSNTWTSPNAAPATKSDTSTSSNAAPAKTSDTWTSPNIAPATKSDLTLLLRDDSSLTWLYYYYYLTLTWLYYYLTLLLLDSTIT